MEDLLPGGVIYEILSYVQNVSGLITVNRLWHSISQRHLYNEIDINVMETDPIVDTIINSNYNPGKFVLKLNIQNLGDPANFSISIHDKINVLINKCPNVIQIQFKRALTLNEWNYFETMIRNRETNWKLKNIIYSFPFTKLTLAHYSRCAAIMNTSLRHFYIGAKTYNIKNMNKLFQNLTSITIKAGAMMGLTECSGVLSLLPNLVEIHAEFNDQKNNFPIIKKIQYKTIKSFNVTYYGVTNEEDFHMILYKFKILENIKLKFQGDTMLRDGIFRAVINNIVSIPKFNLEITNNFNINSMVLLLEKYYKNILDVNHVVDIFYEYNTKRSIRFALDSMNGNLKLTLVSLSSQFENNQDIGKVTAGILTDKTITHYLEIIHFHLDKELNQHVLQNIHNLTSTKKLVFTGGKILANQSNPKRISNISINEIEINTCDLTEFRSLNQFLSYFDNVSLTLTQCQLPIQQDDLTQLYIPTIVLDNLSLNISTSAYVKVKLLDRPLIYYFFDYENIGTDENLSQIITEDMFIKHKLVVPKEATFIFLEAKMLNMLQFNPFVKLNILQS